MTPNDITTFSWIAATGRGHLGPIKALMKKGVDINQRAENGSNGAHFAVSNAKPKALEFLISQGIDADVVNLSGSTPLLVAAWNDKAFECLEILIKAGASVDARDRLGRTPAMLSGLRGLHQHLDALINAGTDLSKTCAKGLTALDYASGGFSPGYNHPDCAAAIGAALAIKAKPSTP